VIVVSTINNSKNQNKQAKMLQYGERVWNITEGSVDERIDAIIEKTVNFFESVGIRTKLADYGVGSEIIPRVVNRFIERGIKGIGERGDLTTDDIAKILELQLK
jgi:NADP-dependent alcohol dehydrogenase